MYRPVPAQVDLPAMERDILTFWRERGIFARSLEQTRDGEPWVFYEGPPTANGRPGTHHIEARVFKDVFPRFQTMKGRYVFRKGGWDCHGLPVELAVETELGFSGKPDIERYGIAEFNARCRSSAERYVGAFEEMTERMGYWTDLVHAYRTMDPDYIQSVWWSLKQIFEAGLLVQDHRVAPYCPRCGTSLSDHELAQGYETVVDPSVYVRFPVTGGPLANLNASLLVWTTTPWTLVSNTAVAVNPEVTYVAARTANGEVLVVAEPLLHDVLGSDIEILVRYLGADLELTPYSRPFDLVDVPEGHIVVLADYVTVDDGTGLVHQSPAFGADDLAVARAYGLPVVNPVEADGRFAAEVPVVGGVFFKKADPLLVADLEARGLLFRHEPYEHSYPHCWRCHTPLMYYAQPSWYIRTTAIKDALLRENENTNWYPATIKHGRYGDWLENNIDWALSRSRYWGTPLPIWRCEADAAHLTVVGSLAELGELAGKDLSGLDPHRPYVDDVVLACPDCGAGAVRVPEVIDVWFDSGAMPFAQWGYPHREGSIEAFEAGYPAQFICEAIDQTRGWFYTLMAIGTLVFDRSSYENVVCLGHILDEQGRKMSKHLGNVLEPMPLMDQHGADAVRWFMAAGGSPWQARRVGHGTISDVVRKTLLTYWNTVSFQSLYARSSGWEPTAPAPPVADRPALDRWALSEAHRVALATDAALEAFDTQRAGRLLSGFVDDLSNWYVRRSRRRFWVGDPSALATLHECLYVVTLLMAPLVPFVTERVWSDLFAATSEQLPDSVHLAAWPTIDGELIDENLAEQMKLVRRLVELGRATRATSGVKTRQPLARAMIAASGWADLPDELRAQVADELNVLDLQSLGAVDSGQELVEVTIKANFRALGKRFGNRTPHVAQAVSAADPGPVAAQLRDAGSAAIEVDGETLVLGTDEIIVTESPRAGWVVATDVGETVALDLALTPELVRAGIAREAIRQIQEARKNAGLDVSDRIELVWEGSGDLADALREHGQSVADEVLATSFAEAPADDPIGSAGEADGSTDASSDRQTGFYTHRDAEIGLNFRFRRRTD